MRNKDLIPTLVIGIRLKLYSRRYLGYCTLGVYLINYNSYSGLKIESFIIYKSLTTDTITGPPAYYMP